MNNIKEVSYNCFFEALFKIKTNQAIKFRTILN